MLPKIETIVPGASGSTTQLAPWTTPAAAIRGGEEELGLTDSACVSAPLMPAGSVAVTVTAAIEGEPAAGTFPGCRPQARTRVP